MKILIAYYSFTGNNEALVEQLRKRLACDILKIEEVKKRRNISILLDLIFKRRPKLKKHNVVLSTYGHVILIAPIWAGKIGTPMLSFLQQERNNIRAYSFMSLCGGVAGQREKIQRFLESAMNTKPVSVEELWVSDLAGPQKQAQKGKTDAPYRVQQEDWEIFNPKIEGFVDALSSSEVAEHA